MSTSVHACQIWEAEVQIALRQITAGREAWPAEGRCIPDEEQCRAVGTMMASLAEALALAQRAGLSQDELLEVLSLGAMANPMFKLKVRPVRPV